MNINLKEDIKPISYIKTNAAAMLDYINERKSPIIITQQGVARGILLDMGSYQEMIDAFALLKLVQIAEAEIEKGETYKHEDVMAEMREQIKQRIKTKNG